MAENKCTSYEISKQLSELGFDCQSHYGWWSISLELEGEFEYWIHRWISEKDLPSGQYQKYIKAYDCYDLLIFLQNCDEVKEEIDNSFKSLSFNKSFVVWDNYVSRTGDTQPQNALGKSCIKILQARLSAKQLEVIAGSI